MIIARILAGKGRDVVTIEPKQTLADAARLLAERRIGAVVVADAQHPVQGIISERDIARAVAQRGAAALQEPLSQHMTTKLFTCTRACTVSQFHPAEGEERSHKGWRMRTALKALRRESGADDHRA